MKLITGKIKIKELVKLMGTNSQLVSYQKTKKIGSNTKKVLLEKLSRYCEYEDLGGGAYKIITVYNSPKPASLSKLQSGIFQYMSPLILLELLNNSDVNKKITLPLYKWARLIDMVNKNYQPTRYNRRLVGEYLEVDISVINEFFEKVDDSMRYYIETCLENLRKADVLEWFKVPMLKKRKAIQGSNFDGDLTLNCDYEHIRATDEEYKYIIDCSEHVRKELEIKTKSECFYGSKSAEYKEKLQALLKQRDILYCYESYEVFYTNEERCKRLLEEFKYEDKMALIKGFNAEFIDMLLKNAEKRKTKEIASNMIKEYRLAENYLADLTIISNLTIPYDCSIDIYKELKLGEDYLDNKRREIERDFNVKLVNKNLK